MIKKLVSLILIFSACSVNAYALNINDLIKPVNPLETKFPVDKDIISVPKKATLTKNDIHNQYAIALNKYIQSNVKSSYSDFEVLIESISPLDYVYLQTAEKMADLGFFNLSELSVLKLQDEDISYMLSEDVKHFYFPAVKLSPNDEIYLAEMYSNIVYNDQSREVTAELVKNTALLQKNDYANYIAALGYLKSNNIIDAEKYIDTAISKNPKNLNYKKLKAEILAQSNKPQNALKVVEDIKKQNLLTTQFKRKVDSIEQYTLYKTKKNEFEKKYHLAYYFYYENELNKSMRTLQTAFNTKKSNNKNVYALLSRVYYDLKEFEKAEDNATKAYKLDKSNVIALLVLGDLAYRDNNFEEALKYYENAASKEKQSYTPDIKVADTCQKLGKNKKAFEIYSKILRTHSDCYEAYYNMALLDKTRELPYLKKSVAINSQFKDGWIDLARVAIGANKLNLASNYLAVAKYIDENDFRYYYYQGLVYKNKGLTGDAKRSFRKSIMLNPDYAPAKEELSI